MPPVACPPRAVVLPYAAMSGNHAANEPIALPLAAQVAGVPARTLRNWIAGGKLAAIRGQRGWLVRTADIAAITALLGTATASAASAASDSGMADDLAASVAVTGGGAGDDAATGATAATSAAITSADRAAEGEALVQRLLAPFIAEQTRLAEELGATRAERDAALRRAEAAEAELSRRQEESLSGQPENSSSPPPAPPSEAEASGASDDAADPPGGAGGLRGWLRRWFGGA